MKTFAPDLIAVFLATLATCASAGVFDDAPPTRAEVRAQYLEAQKNGDLVVGENGETARDLNPRAYPAHPDNMPKTSRAPIRAEFIAAQRAGDLIIGENGETARELNPRAYPARQDQPDQDMQQPAPSPRGQVREADWSYYGI